MSHINIPIFIPHLGCPNQCIFCNQKHISGEEKFNENTIKSQITRILSTVNGKTCEIAFFGGSFTGIERSLMIKLLDIAQEFVNSGKVCGIRMSTRPDYISKEIINILSNYTITCVELGIQTINEDVLNFLKRGHTFADTEQAVCLLNEAKIPFVGQMMIGLPTATKQDEINCANFIAKHNACGARIYPTLVLNDTELANLYISGKYIPLELTEAVDRASEVLQIFIDNNIPCIRIGLCDSENLHSDKTFLAGPNSPSIGEMVKSRIYYKKIVKQLKILEPNNESIIIKCPKGRVSQIIGLKKENILNINKKFNIAKLTISEIDCLKEFDVMIEKED